MIRRHTVFPLLALAGLAVAQTAAAPAIPTVAIDALLKEPKTHDGKAIVVRGKVSDFRQRTSRAGNPYFTFKMGEGEKTVNVYGRGTLEPAPKEGQIVEATGLYRIEKKSGSMTFKNEIDVSKDRQRPKETEKFGVKLIG